jgi:hypothetical protein
MAPLAITKAADAAKAVFLMYLTPASKFPDERSRYAVRAGWQEE